MRIKELGIWIMNRKITLSLCFVLSAISAAINADEWGMSVGYVSSDGNSGGNVGGYYRHHFDSLLIKWTVLDVNMFSKEPEGYREETLSNGNTICRDESNGQFADDEKCNQIDIDVGSSIELGYGFNAGDIPSSLSAGVRLFGDKEYGDAVIPYVAGGLSFDSAFGVLGADVRVGSSYTQISVSVNF